MKLYSINCYGVNMAIGVNEKDAIAFYLHRHPELIEVDEIEEKLQATEVLSDFNFAELFRILHMQSEDGDSSDRMLMMTIHKYTASNYIKEFTTEQKFNMLTLLEWMKEGMTIYGDEFSFNDLIYNGFPFDDLMKLI